MLYNTTYTICRWDIMEEDKKYKEDFFLNNTPFDIQSRYLEEISDNDIQKIDKDISIKIAEEGQGKWFLSSEGPIYFPKHDEYYSMFTDRNRDVISPNIQEKIRATQFLVFGVGSTGGDFSSTIAQIGAENILIADMDVLDVSNLNRQHGSISAIGKNKTDIIAKKIWDINPYSKVDQIKEKLTPKSITTIIDSLDKEAIIFLAMDDKDCIIRTHVKAQEKKIPIFMVTDIGHAIHLSIFDYSKENKKIFNGKISLEEAEKMSLLEFTAKFIEIKDLPNEYLSAAINMLSGKSRFIPQVTTASKKAGAIAVEQVISYFEGRKSKLYKMHDTIKSQSTRTQRLIDSSKKPKKFIELVRLKKALSKSTDKLNTF